jgi:hypothetical protein
LGRNSSKVSLGHGENHCLPALVGAMLPGLMPASFKENPAAARPPARVRRVRRPGSSLVRAAAWHARNVNQGSLTMATAKQPAPPTPDQLTYSVACVLDVPPAELSPEQRLDVLKRLHDSVLRRMDRERPQPDPG